jgi:hypothetical protein
MTNNTPIQAGACNRTNGEAWTPEANAPSPLGMSAKRKTIYRAM